MAAISASTLANTPKLSTMKWPPKASCGTDDTSIPSIMTIAMTMTAIDSSPISRMARSPV